VHNLCPGRWRERVIKDTKEIRNHVESYYKSLFGKEQEGSITLGDNFWNERGRMSNEEAQELIIPFTLKELEVALKDMEVNSAPGPDGLPVGFYREFWP
jgi:DNA-directed RNA polymerase delta subunit